MNPLIVTENIAERIQPVVTPSGDVGYEETHLWDNFYNTTYKIVWSAGFSITIVNASNDCYGDIFIIESLFADAGATIAITYNSGTTFVTTVVGLTAGKNVFQRAGPVLMNEFTVTITVSITQRFELRNFWFGLSKAIAPPRYSFDPYETAQIRNEVNDANLGQIINQVLSNKSKMKMSFGMLDPVSELGALSLTNIRDLIDNCIAYGLPFWYFWSNLKLTEGKLVICTDTEIKMPYEEAATKSFSMEVMEV